MCVELVGGWKDKGGGIGVWKVKDNIVWLGVKIRGEKRTRDYESVGPHKNQSLKIWVYWDGREEKNLQILIMTFVNTKIY